MAVIVFKDESSKIIGACFEVYEEMGYGFLKHVYLEYLYFEFRKMAVHFESQKKLMISCEDCDSPRIHKADFICFGKIIVELKAVPTLLDEHRLQLLDCLNASGLKHGILINFGHPSKLEYKEIVL